MIRVKRALISVSDKSGIAELAGFLHKSGVEILSTGGTLRFLREAGIPAIAVEDETGFPEMLDGRVKTLHPKIHAGLLALLDRPEHQAAMAEHNIRSIDLLIVNLYPFAATIARDGVTLEEAIENIDIGGPTMLRSAAKNYRFTVSVTNPADYEVLRTEIERDGGISEQTSFRLARDVFNHTASYDAIIAGYLNEKTDERFPETLTLTFRKEQPLRYGENPHQQAAFYRPLTDLAYEEAVDMEGSVQLHGKELSFNNILDLSAALACALDLPGPGVVIVKHLNPCGAAVAAAPDLLDEAFIRARACDPVSAFGGVIAITGMVDKLIAELVTENFVEAVIAPEFTSEALDVLFQKKNLRVITVNDPGRYLKKGMELRQVYNGALYQDLDTGYARPADWKCVTKLSPDEEMLRGLEFAWRLVKHVKSNAIVFTDAHASLAIGAGQMSRIDSADIAVKKAGKAGHSLAKSFAASDAFFPFRDGVDALIDAGARAIVQPGGSVRDDEVIAACDERGVVMMFTGRRHFRH